MADRDLAATDATAALAALSSGWVVGVSLADVDLRWAALPGYWFTDTLSRGVLALLVAIGAAAVGRRATPRTAWLVSGGAALVVALVETALSLAPDRHPDLLRSVGSVAAGLILGCATAAAWPRRPDRVALVFGVVAGWAVALPWLYRVDGTVLRLFPATLAALTALRMAYRSRSIGRGPGAASTSTDRFALGGALGLGAVSWMVGGWLGNGATPGSFATIGGVGLVGIAVGTEWCARHAPATDRRFVPFTVAATAGLMSVVIGLAVPRSPGLTLGLVAAGAGGVAVGLAGARHSTAAPIGLALLAAVPLLGLGYPAFAGNGLMLAAAFAIAAVGAGLAIGSAVPRQVPVAVLGLGSIAPVCALLAGFYDSRTLVVYRPAAFVADPARSATVTALQGSVSLPWPMTYRYGALCMLVLIGCCSWSAFRRRDK